MSTRDTLYKWYRADKDNFIILDNLVKDNAVFALFNKYNNTILLQFNNPKYVCLIGDIKGEDFNLVVFLENKDYKKTYRWVGEFSKAEYIINTLTIEYKLVGGEYELITKCTYCPDSEILCRELIDRDKSLIALCREYLKTNSLNN